jgi:putative phosphoribosyl transferase
MAITTEVEIGRHGLPGILAEPGGARGLVIFAHGSGSGRQSPRNIEVAAQLQQMGISTLLFDLLSEEESADRRNVFDIPLLADRLVEAIEWVRSAPRAAKQSIGLFGASTGAAAALVAAALVPEEVSAVVSRGGRPDMAEAALAQVKAPTLLIVGGADPDVLTLNEGALNRLHCTKRLAIVPGAGHLFAEPGTMAQVIRLAGAWFETYLKETRHADRAIR